MVPAGLAPREGWGGGEEATRRSRPGAARAPLRPHRRPPGSVPARQGSGPAARHGRAPRRAPAPLEPPDGAPSHGPPRSRGTRMRGRGPAGPGAGRPGTRLARPPAAVVARAPRKWRARGAQAHLSGERERRVPAAARAHVRPSPRPRPRGPAPAHQSPRCPPEASSPGPASRAPRRPLVGQGGAGRAARVAAKGAPASPLTHLHVSAVADGEGAPTPGPPGSQGQNLALSAGCGTDRGGKAQVWARAPERGAPGELTCPPPALPRSRPEATCLTSRPRRASEPLAGWVLSGCPWSEGHGAVDAGVAPSQPPSPPRSPDPTEEDLGAGELLLPAAAGSAPLTASLQDSRAALGFRGALVASSCPPSG
ncbi:skin secretory protein xP2-like [Loxodonta africana]|uniref:skin secretory protein xP2-like n=1 Tax=Loxodonta africana TaxID=9785 RepID=UPI0030D49CD2